MHKAFWLAESSRLAPMMTGPVGLSVVTTSCDGGVAGGQKVNSNECKRDCGQDHEGEMSI